MTKRVSFFMVLLLVLCVRPAFAWGEEEFGNAPLSEANYTSWPGILPSINQESRVYRVWVNGNEHFYYRGDMGALHKMLTAFSEVKGEDKEVVLRPGPGICHSFNQAKKIEFGWTLHIIGGVASMVTKKDQGDKIWPDHPVLTIYLTKEMDIKKLIIPVDMKVHSLSTVKQRVREALKSQDQTVRGWGADELVHLDIYDAESQKTITHLLQDEDSWVRLNAVGAIAEFGNRAKPALPLLREQLKSDDPSLKQAAEKSIQTIQEAKEDPETERTHRDLMKQIERFVARRESRRL